MAASVFPLGTYTIGTADYSAGAARTAGAYCLVRKQYGNNQAIYNYAAFQGITLADFQAICANPDAAATWLPYPYSNYDWQFLVQPLASPLAPSTAASGPIAATGGGTADVTPVVTALNSMSQKLPNLNADGSMALKTADSGQPLLVRIQPAANPPTLANNAATETTLAKVATALAGTLTVHADGTLSMQFAGPQPVTGPATDAQLRATPLPVAVAFPSTQQVAGTVIIGNASLPVTLPITAATTQGQADATAQLVALNNKAAAGFTVTTTNPTPATDVTLLAKDATLSGGLGTDGTTPPALAGTGVRGWLRGQFEKLEAIRLLLAAPILPGSASTAAKQDTGNTLLTSILNAYPALATGAKQDAIATALGNLLTALGPLSTAAKQDAAATLAATANGYLQTLATTGVAVTSAPATVFSLVTVNGNNATLLRPGATWLLGGTVTNTAAAVRFLMLYNLPTAPTGTTAAPAPAPLLTVAIGPGATVALPVPAGRYIAFPAGLALAAAAGSLISTVTTTVAALGVGTGITAGELVINVTYAA